MSHFMEFKSPKHSTNLEHVSSFEIFQKADAIRKTSIICTIGPDSNNVDTIIKLRKAGMNILRLNFSHGSYEWHSSAIANLHKSFEVFPSERCVAIALDTKGPEIRTGVIPDNGRITYSEGSTVYISSDISDEYKQTNSLIFSNYARIGHQLKIGKIVSVDDDLLPLRVTGISSDFKMITTIALATHTIESRRHINLPGTSVDLPGVSSKDAADLRFGVEHGVDMIFASFIRNASDIQNIRDVLGDKGSYIKIVAKIENQEGLQHFDEILKSSDGIMVARGDLGIEIPHTKVFLAQKMMISKARIAGKPAICATQMLESMMTSTRPLRAEITDVANAVLDGADCVMLSGETAKGKYPSQTVKVMHEICIEAENVLDYWNNFGEIQKLTNAPLSITESIASSAVNASLSLNIAAIVVLSFSGDTASLISKYRPRCPLICVCKEESTARQMHLYFGTIPYSYPYEKNDSGNWIKDSNARKRYAIFRARKDNILPEEEDLLILWIWGATWGRGHSNVIRIGKISEIFSEETVLNAVEIFKSKIHK